MALFAKCVGAAIIVAASAIGAAAEGSGRETHISIVFSETHDRLPPDAKEGIVAQHEIIATLSPDNSVREQVTSRAASVVRSNGTNELLGDETGAVVWRVLGPNKLRRIVPHRQFLVLTEIEISRNSSCSVEVRYLLQRGYTDVIMRRGDNSQPWHFTLPKVLSAECSIH